jgi:hypothetical protein
VDVVSLAPVPVASLRWRLGDGDWMQTLVCKLTIKLAPGTSLLAKRHDPIYEHDRFPDDGQSGGPYAPADLVPGKPCVDVTLVGAAYAPNGHPCESLVARLEIGSLDKSLTVESDDPFKSAPLSYRSPADNGAAAHGAVRIKPLAPGGALAPPNSWRLAGFGPVASHWPSRNALLRGSKPPSDLAKGDEVTLADDFDLQFFNAAPPDQQIDLIRPGDTLVLENLHPEHGTLRTHLPLVSPQAFVERPGGKRSELEMKIDSLWIDTTRCVATLTWRAQLSLTRLEEPGKIWLAVAGPGKRLSNDGLARLIRSLGGASDDDEPTSAGDPLGETQSMRRKARKSDEDTMTSVLSGEHTSAAKADEGTSEDALDPDGTIDGPGWLKPIRAKNSETGEMPSMRAQAALPPHFRRAPAATGANERGPLAGAAPLLRQPMPTQPGVGPFNSAVARSAAVSGGSGVPSSAAAARGAAGSKGTAGPKGAARPTDNAGPASIGAASSMAAASMAAASIGSPVSGRAPDSVWQPRPPNPLADTSSLPQKVEPKPESKAPARRRAPEDRQVVELLWFDAKATGKLRVRWPALCDELDFAPRDPKHDLPAAEGRSAREHHVHFGVLTEAASHDVATIGAILRDAISDGGRFTPPLVLLRGRLSFPFEHVEILRATAASVAPLAGDDKKLKEALQQVKEVLDTPLVSGSSETVANFTGHLRKVYSQAKRSLSLEYLDDMVERILLEQRRYQKRTLFGGTWLRGVFTPEGTKEQIPTYLPEELEKQLPMMVSFRARLIAEAHVKQDQYEAHPHALRIVTLGRILDLDNSA